MQGEPKLLFFTVKSYNSTLNHLFAVVLLYFITAYKKEIYRLFFGEGEGGGGVATYAEEQGGEGRLMEDGEGNLFPIRWSGIVVVVEWWWWSSGGG